MLELAPNKRISFSENIAFHSTAQIICVFEKSNGISERDADVEITEE